MNETAEKYNQLGKEKIKSGNYDKALEYFSKAISVKNDYVNAYCNRGNCYSDLGEKEKAIKDYNKAIAINPDFVPAYYNRGTYYFNKGDADNAIKDFTKVINLKAENNFLVLSYIERAKSFYGKKMFENVFSDLESALEIDSDNAKIYGMIGALKGNLGLYEEALSAFSKAVDLEPENIKYYIERIKVNRYLKKYSDVINDYKKIKYSNLIDFESDKAMMFLKEDFAKLLVSGNKQATSLEEIPEGIGEFGLTATNPVPVKGLVNDRIYLNKLRTVEGKKVEYIRLSSTKTQNIEMPVDIYKISVDGSYLTKIYISPYHKKTSTKAPKGFNLIS
ncbi:MAG: hypothetical protein DRI94_06690 [Bacteroidetes bacterium]|nr:MAG: hypothetical protein DRI94_06690 [Bacteroidota bacterium]